MFCWVLVVGYLVMIGCLFWVCVVDFVGWFVLFWCWFAGWWFYVCFTD